MIFKFSIGGYFASNYWISYRSGKLLCYTSDYPMPPKPGDMLTIQLKEESWNRFLSFLIACTWEKEYVTEMDDGIQWELKAKGTEFNIKTYGSNAFPNNFPVFIGLLNEVIEEAGFRISYP